MVQQLQTAGLVIIVVFEVFGTLFALLRLWARLLLPAGSWRGLMIWSDVCLALAWVFSVGESFCQYQLTILAHFGYHLADAQVLFHDTIPQIVVWQQYSLANQLLYNPILSFVKVSVILLYLRLGGHVRGIRLSCYALAAFTLILMVIIFFVDLFQCLPFPYNYNSILMDLEAQQKAGAGTDGLKDGKLIKGGSCIAQVNFYLISAGFTILTDLLVLAIPIAMVNGLQMKLKKKIVVTGILSMGVGVTAISIARLPVLSWMFSKNNTDPLYTVGQTISAIETGLAIAAACAPDLYPLLSRLFPHLFSSAGNSSYGKGASRPTRKAYTISDSHPAHMGSRAFGEHRSQAVDTEAYPLSDIEWNKKDKHIDGAVTTVIVGIGSKKSESQEQIVAYNDLQNEGRITKTIQFQVKNEVDDKNWSNI